MAVQNGCDLGPSNDGPQVVRDARKGSLLFGMVKKDFSEVL